MCTWTVENLDPRAVGVSASRRTDIPALYASWFEGRLEEGLAEYVPGGPPRRIQRPLNEREVTHFCFWSKWPRPFFRALDRVLQRGYPVLWNVTISGLGGTPAEPHVPPAGRVVAAVRELARRVPPGAIQWRYDPIFLTSTHDEAHHRRLFAELAAELAGSVDRVACSFVDAYERRVAPDLRAYEAETGERVARPALGEQVELAGTLAAIARSAGLELTACCSAELAAELPCQSSGCNSWSWACRVYPALRRHRRLRNRPTRRGCTCSEEVDIGVYDTCTLGCRYCYASRTESAARARSAHHDPAGRCLLP